MVTITVIRPFLLNLGGEKRVFPVGVHSVEEEVASHWYVQAHTAPLNASPESDQPEKAEPQEDADEAKQAKQRGK